MVRYFKHIYFESKKPGKDSVYEAVPDLGKPGVRSSKEIKLLAGATVADLADGYTVNHEGRRIRFTPKLLSGRFLVLRRLANRFGGKRYVVYAQRVAREALKIKDARKRKMFIKRALKKMGISTAMVEQLIARTNSGRRKKRKKTRKRKKSRRKRKKKARKNRRKK